MRTQNQSAFTLIEIMVVVAIIGLLAAICIPNIQEAIRRSRAQACQINRKNIDAAKLQWALATDQPQSATPTDQDIFGTKRFIEHKPNCPAGGAYALNAVEEHCTCDVVEHRNGS